jgi:Lon protease-like protein
MLRRCVQNTDPCLGMIMPLTSGTGNDFGTMLQITGIMMLDDGRSMVETHGIYCFQIVERGTLDGYVVARIERCGF